jgi:hypothetical protein
MIQATVFKTFLFEEFLLRKVNNDPQIFPHVNMGRPNVKYDIK